MDIFPFVQTNMPKTENTKKYKEVAWDFEKDIPIFENKAPKIVEGLEAVKTWVYKALKTERFKHEIYTHSFGNDVFNLIGKPFTSGVKTAEAKRYIEECLLINKYIKSVSDVEVTFGDGKLKISCKVNTIYGSEGVSINV